MWIITTEGVFSVTRSPRDPDRQQIRARVRRDLVNLREAVPALKGKKIIQTPLADYRYRLIVSPAEVRAVMRHFAEDVTTYENFKNEVGRRGRIPWWHDALMRIWGIGFSVQRENEPPEDSGDGMLFPLPADDAEDVVVTGAAQREEVEA